MKNAPQDLPVPDQPVSHYPYTDRDDEINLVELWQILMRYKGLIILTTLFAIVIAAVVAFSMTPVYRAEALLVPAEQKDNRYSQYAGLANMAGIDLGDSGKSSKGEIALAVLQSRAFATAFIQDEQLMPILFAKHWDSQKQRWRVKQGEKPPTLWNAYTSFTDILDIKEEKTGLVKLAIEWENPQQAANWVNKLAHRLNRLTKERDIQQAQRSIEYLNKELAKTSIVEVQQAIYNLIESQIKTTMMANILDDYVFRIIDPAVIPEQRIKPKRKLIVLLGAMVGFLLAVLLAFFMHFLATQREQIKQNDGDD